MIRSFIALMVLFSIQPASADESAKVRELEEKFFDKAVPGSQSNDGESGVTSKGCHWQNVPKWFRDKYLNNKGAFVIQDIQNSLVGDAILASGRCSCEVLYPSWDEAISVYEKDFREINAFAAYGTESQSFLRRYHDRAQKLISHARAICQKAGVF